MQTPGGTTRSTASRILQQEHQEDEESFDEEESDEDEQLEELLIEEQDRDDVDSLKANRQDPGFIEEEKMRRRLKRLKEEKEKEESRLGQLSPPSPHFSEDTVLPNFVWEEGDHYCNEYFGFAFTLLSTHLFREQNYNSVQRQ